MTSDELSVNDFYFLITKMGDYLRTKNNEDFEIVLSWDNGNILFSGKIQTSNFLHFKCGQIWLKKKFAHLQTSKSSEETIWYDIHNLDLKNHSNIKQIKIGGSKTPETFELL